MLPKISRFLNQNLALNWRNAFRTRHTYVTVAVTNRSPTGSEWVTSERSPLLDIGLPQGSPFRPVLCYTPPPDSRNSYEVVTPSCWRPTYSSSPGSFIDDIGNFYSIKMAEVSLLIDDQVFKANKDLLCEFSDYFRAMFSGNYVENEKQEIRIDVIDAESMKIILQYMNIGLIDLTEYSISTIGDLVTAANFLQITELIKQIEYTLDLQISPSTCLEIMIIAHNSGFVKLEQFAASCALLSFKSMKPEYVPNMTKLCWYLSHPYLDAQSELDVFKFGYKWLLQNETAGDALLIILGCLDLEKLNLTDLIAIKTSMQGYPNSLASKLVDCLHKMVDLKFNLSVDSIQSQQLFLHQTYTERVYNEILNLAKESKNRLLTYTPAVSVWNIEDHSMYKFSEKSGFENWLTVAEKGLWGWSVVAWGSTKLVVVGGEHNRGTGVFMKDVKVYDTLRKEWTHHGVQLPGRRHAGVAILGDSLFIIGGVGGYRIVSDNVIIYDLKMRSHRLIANFPDAIQSPAVCVHEGSIYASGQRYIYKYEDFGDKDTWSVVISTEIRPTCMTSYKGYIYYTQSYFSYLYRFQPGVDKELELVLNFANPPATICNLGNRLLFFTRPACSDAGALFVEEYTGKNATDKPKVLWSMTAGSIRVNEVAGSCSLVMSTPPLLPDTSNYIKNYLKRYENPV